MRSLEARVSGRRAGYTKSTLWFMENNYFEITSAYKGDRVVLPTRVFDIHIVRTKIGGPMLPSVFEIQKAIEAPEVVQRSKKDADALIYIRKVGRLGGATWRTVVVASAAREGYRAVSTAYNVYNTVSKGEIIWARGA